MWYLVILRIGILLERLPFCMHLFIIQRGTHVVLVLAVYLGSYGVACLAPQTPISCLLGETAFILSSHGASPQLLALTEPLAWLPLPVLCAPLIPFW